MERGIEEKNKMISLENMYNCMTAYDRLLNDKTYVISASTLMLVLRHLYYVGRHVLIGASTLLLVLRHLCYLGRHVLITTSTLLLVLRHFCYMGRHVSVQYCTIPSGSWRTVSISFMVSGLGKQL